MSSASVPDRASRVRALCPVVAQAAAALLAPFPLMAHDVRMRGDRAWVAGDTWWGLIELDISDPADLVATGSVDSSGSGRALAVDAARVLLADWDAGVRVFGCNAIFADGFQ